MSAGAIWELIGRTMLHTVWVGGLIALVAGVGRRGLRKASADVRYVHALVSLVLLGFSPLAIGWSLWPEVERSRPVEAGAFVVPASASPAPPSGVVRWPDPALRLSGSKPDSHYDKLISVLPYVWITGTPLTFLVLAFGMIGAERLRRHSCLLSDQPIGERCRVLSGSLGISRTVLVGLCDRVAGPVLIGVVRPMILLPTSALSGWTPEELEFVLLHELIHVRRGDNLVQLVQGLIESFLFFHPAAWLLSGWVRLEREHCCDAAVVACTGTPAAYARVLLHLSLQGLTPSPPRTGLAMARHHLVTRIQYLLGNTEEPMRHGTFSRMWIGSACLLLLVPALLVLAQALPSKQPPDAAREQTLRALETLAREGRGGMTSSRVDLLIRVARIRAQAGQSDRAKEMLTLAAQIADRGEQYVSKGAPGVEAVEIAEGLTAFIYTVAGESTRQMLCRIATEQSRIGDRAPALDTLERAARARDPKAGLATRISALAALARAFRDLGNAERARSIDAEIERLAVPTAECPVMFLIPQVFVAHCAAGEAKRGFTYLDRALNGMPTPRERIDTEVMAIRSMGMFFVEDALSVEEETVRECVRRVDLRRDSPFRASAIESLAVLLARRGALPEAFRLIDSIQEDLSQTVFTPLAFRVQALQGVAGVLRKAGRTEQAAETLDRAILEAKTLRGPSPIAWLIVDQLLATRDVARVAPWIESIPRGERALVLALVSRFRKERGQAEAARTSLADADADIEYRRTHRAEIEHRNFDGQVVRGVPATFWEDLVRLQQVQVQALAGDRARAQTLAANLGAPFSQQGIQAILQSMALDGRLDEAFDWLRSAKLSDSLRSYGEGEVARLLADPADVSLR